MAQKKEPTKAQDAAPSDDLENQDVLAAEGDPNQNKPQKPEPPEPAKGVLDGGAIVQAMGDFSKRLGKIELKLKDTDAQPTPPEPPGEDSWGKRVVRWLNS